MIFESLYGVTKFIKIGNTFTMIWRVKSKLHSKCDDIHIIPSIMIKNCLPVKMYFKLNQSEFTPVKLDKNQEKHISLFSESA